MEKRWNERILARLSVALQYPPLGLIMGKTRDISINGMFVETGCVLIYPNEVVNISFSYPCGDAQRVATVTACVRHTSAEGIGLQFEDFKFEQLHTDETLAMICAYH